MTWTRYLRPAPGKRFVPSALWSTRLEYSDDTDTTSYTTPSVTVAAGVYLIAVYGGATFPNAVQGAVTAFGATWEVVAETYYADNGGTESRRLTVWRAELASEQSGTVGVVFSASQLFARVILIGLPGARSGSNGADAIVQAVPVESDVSVTTLEATLAAFQDSRNYTLGIISRNNSVDATPGSGFVLIGSALGTTPATALNVEAVNVNDTTVDFSWAGGSKSSAIGIEVRYANVAPAVTVDAGSSSDRGRSRQTAAGIAVVSGQSADRGRSRQTASSLAIVSGTSSDRARGRQTASSSVTAIGQSSDRARGRQTASSSVTTTGQSSDRARARETASGTSVVVALGVARSRGREAGTALNVALGRSEDRGRARATASATVTVAAGSSSDRGRSRETANGTVPAATVDAGTSSSRSRGREAADALNVALGRSEARSRGRETAGSSVTTTGTSSDRARGRETAYGDVPAATIDAGMSSSRSRGRETATPAAITTTAFSIDRARARETAIALAIIGAGVSADHSRGRERADGSTEIFLPWREASTRAITGLVGAGARGGEVGRRAVTSDIGSRKE